MKTSAAPTVHLQGIGLCPAVRADALKAGDVTMWNSGALQLVLSVERISPAFYRANMVTLTWRTATHDFLKGDRVWTRRLKADRLVGIAPNIAAEIAALPLLMVEV